MIAFDIESTSDLGQCLLFEFSIKSLLCQGSVLRHTVKQDIGHPRHVVIIVSHAHLRIIIRVAVARKNLWVFRIGELAGVILRELKHLVVDIDTRTAC